MSTIRFLATLSLFTAFHCSGNSLTNADDATDSDDQTVQAEVQKARLKVLQSARWKKAKSDFDKWLSVQSIYSDAQVEVLESEMRNRIAQMKADELEKFLAEMEAKLAILLSPATTDARNWVNKYYTESAQQRMIKKYGVEDPIRLSAEEIEGALESFYADRQRSAASSAAFDLSRKRQVKATQDYRTAQAKARAAAAKQSRSPPRSSTSYAPRKNNNPQVYRAPYPKSGYSIGPWGGVWLHR